MPGSFHFYAAPQKRGRIPEGGQDLAAIIAAMGFCVSFQRWSEPLADGSAVYTVYVYRPGNSCFRKNLGRLSELAGMDKETIQAKVVVLFPRSQDLSS